MFLNRFNKIFITRHLRLKLFMVLLLSTLLSYSQEKKKIEILQAGYMATVADNANVQRLVDSVIIRHKNIMLWCDSAYTYSGTR